MKIKTQTLIQFNCSTAMRAGRKLALVATLAATTLVASLKAQPALPVYEPFNYANAERLGTTGLSGTNWANAINSTGATSPIVTNAVTLSYPGMPDQTGLSIWFSPTGLTSGRSRGMAFIPEVVSLANPTVYYSFFLNVVSNPGAGLRDLLVLSATTNSLSTPMSLFLTAEGKLALGKNSSTVATITNSTVLGAGTHLIVVRYKFATGSANDELAVWQDPGSLGVGEGSVPAASAAITSGTDATSSTLGSVCVVQLSGVPVTPAGEFYIDELRVAKTWAAVTPSGCTPGTAFAVTGGGAYCAGDSGVSVGLAGSQTGVDYHLKLGGVDVGSVITGSGPAIDFGLQTAPGSYSVLASNTSTFCVGYMTGTAVVVSNAPPAISGQPSPALATNSVGGLRTYTVTATGSGLNYQWRHAGTNLLNGGGITGATLSTLTINPVATSHAGTYDCVVSGTCSPAATSDPVVLAVRLPANLTWVGGGANLWDITTPNWTGDDTLFADGDNVTFNNSGNNSPAIDLVGIITPVVINVNASQDYTIGTTTTGSLGGSSSINKSGSGTLTLATSNNFVGKTTITGGTVSIDAGNKLGAAPVSFVADQLTLNGGALQITASGNINANRGTTLGASGGTYNVDSGILFTNTPVTTGPGSLTKIGSGTLRLPTANTYLGNTVISNGIVSVGNAGAFGSGTIVMAGGTLDFPAATTLTNSLQVAENSTLTFGTTGNSAVILNGIGFTGTSGKTLTITPSVATTTSTRVRVNNGLTNSFTLDADLYLNGTFTFATYNNQGDQTYNGVLSGVGTLGRRSPLGGVAGRTILNGDNTYSGGTAIADGAIGFGINSTGSPTVTSGPIGTGALSFENNAGTLHCLFASGGARTVGNAITWPTGANQDLTIEGTQPLTLAGDMDLGGSDRTITTSNSANTVLSGVLSNGGLIKSGPGVLLLNGNNTYASVTTVSNGTLGGIGTIAGSVAVVNGGNLAPGASVGTLTINGDLTLGGTFTAEVNSAGTSDLVTGLGTVNYGGTLAVVNVGPALTVSSAFKLFSATSYGSTLFTSVTPSPGAGLVWDQSTLTTDGTLRITTGSSVDPTPTNIVISVSGNTLTLQWPASHTGWTLQTQTNSLNTGLGTNWVAVPGSTTTNKVEVPIVPANPTVFYRMWLQP